MTATRPTLEDLLASVPAQDQLDEKVRSDVHLEVLGGKILGWKGLRAYLGLSQQEEEAIDHDVRTTERKRVAILLKWREKLGIQATYRNLANTFYDAGRINLVGEICELLGAHSLPLLRSRGDQEFNGTTERNCPACRYEENVPINMEVVDNTELVQGDHFAVLSALHPVASRWRPVGLALGLLPPRLEIIKSEHSDPEACLDQVITQWLRRNYDVGKFGHPSWRKLVEAVAHPAGGKNPSLAGEIAVNHRVLGEVSSQSLLTSRGRSADIGSSVNERVCVSSSFDPTPVPVAQGYQRVSYPDTRLGEVSPPPFLTSPGQSADMGSYVGVSYSFDTTPRGFQRVSHPDTILDDRDHREITGYFVKLTKTQVTALGVQLGLNYRWLSDRENSVNYRNDVADAWLKMQDSCLDVGPPTWRCLVGALRKLNQNGIADTVASERNVV